jgi:hypothetical protein
MFLAVDDDVASHRVRTKSAIDCFAWQYAFHARLVYGRAPMRTSQLVALAQAVHAFRGHLDPIAVADEVLLLWPFDVTEWGGLH